MMKNSKQTKLENQERLKELNPYETLKKINIKSNDVVCDLGAGSGIFTIPAAHLTESIVYALETDLAMLEIIKNKAKAEGISNISLVHNGEDEIKLSDNTVDLLLLVTVLHEIENKSIFLGEIKRVLKIDGRIMIIEFYKRETPFGPPVSHRIAKDEVLEVMNSAGFVSSNEFALGDNFYCMVFEGEE